MATYGLPVTAALALSLTECGGRVTEPGEPADPLVGRWDLRGAGVTDTNDYYVYVYPQPPDSLCDHGNGIYFAIEPDYGGALVEYEYTDPACMYGPPMEFTNEYGLSWMPETPEESYVLSIPHVSNSELSCDLDGERLRCFLDFDRVWTLRRHDEG